jgi:hypothetical protein
MERLDRDVPANDRIMGAIHHTHGSATEFLADFVPARLGQNWQLYFTRWQIDLPAVVQNGHGRASPQTGGTQRRQ